MIERRRLGRTGLEVSALGYGGIPIMRASFRIAIEAIRTATDLGIDFIDTARGYGDSEEKIGQAIRGIDRTPIIASKSPSRDREGMLSDFHKSLRCLGVSRIDLYQLHCVSKQNDFERATGKDGAYRALEELKEEGLVSHIGISSHNPEVLKQAIEFGGFDTIQLIFNFLEPEANGKIIDLALEKDIGVIAMKPLAGGFIQNYELGLRFVLSRPGIIAIPGMADKHEVRLNIEVAKASARLTRDDMAAIETIRKETGTVYCRRCDYCQPCESEIPISFALHVPSIRMRVGDDAMRVDAYRDLLAKVRSCQDCGRCEDRCPFGLPIRNLLSKTASILCEVLG